MLEINASGAAAGRTQSLYRKYRPTTFNEDDLVGQEHVSRTLRNAIAKNRVGHAYLFCGPRGTGKTSTARLLAKAVNCLDPDPAARPCNDCEACNAINAGRATDIIEIDAASNRGIEDIRDLREQVKYAPTQLRHKFYIIDEAHRLTRDAFNAFLKTLEEPPPNTTFILATTDPDDLPDTVASRCQRFDFHRIPAAQMSERLEWVAGQESIQIEPDALRIIVRHATGSLRDALSALDMLTTAASELGDGTITDMLARRMLGLSQDERTLGVIQAIADRDLTAGLELINEVVDSGQEMRSFGRQLLAALRLMMLVNAGAQPAEADEEVRRLAGRFELPELLRINRLFSEVDFAIRHGGFPQLPVELAFVGAVVGEAGPAAATPAGNALPGRAASVRSQPTPGSSGADRQRHAQPPATATGQSPAPPPAPETPASSQPAAPASGSADIGVFVEAWPAIRTEVKIIDRKVEALLASTDPAYVAGETLYLAAAYPFHAGKLNEARVRSVIENAVANATNRAMSVVTVLRDEIPTGGVEPAAPPTPTPTPPQPDRPAGREQPESQVTATESPEVEPTAANGNGSAHDDEAALEMVKAILNAEEVDPAELLFDPFTSRN
jgi:DNA polymerase-3 subunit gamma/tau